MRFLQFFGGNDEIFHWNAHQQDRKRSYSDSVHLFLCNKQVYYKQGFCVDTLIIFSFFFSSLISCHCYLLDRKGIEEIVTLSLENNVVNLAMWKYSLWILQLERQPCSHSPVQQGKVQRRHFLEVLKRCNSVIFYVFIFCIQSALYLCLLLLNIHYLLCIVQQSILSICVFNFTISILLFFFC